MLIIERKMASSYKMLYLLFYITITTLYFLEIVNSTVTTSIDSSTGKVLVQWSAPPSNGAPISSYLIEIQDVNAGWQSEPIMCNGNNLAVVGQRQCLIPMQTLTGSQFGLTFDTLIQVRVAAANSKGTGPWSSLLTLGAKVRTIPQAVANPTRGTATNEFQIQVNWAAQVPGIATGNSDILSYELYWDSGNSGAGTTIEIIEAQTTTYTIVGLIASRSYTFKVRAKNIYGYGPFSSPSTIKTTDKPYTMDPVSTDTNGLNIVLSWNPPQTGGEDIDSYEIKLYIPSSDTYVVDTANCNGAVDAIKTSRTCTFDMVYLNTQYSFLTGDILQGIGRAHNIYGWGDYSKMNAVGASIITKPTKMEKPSLGLNTDKDTLQVSWQELIYDYQTGGSAITSYNLEQYSGANWNEVVGNTTSFLGLSTNIEGVSVGTTYTFRIRAKNYFGFGQFSESALLSPIDAPDKMAKLRTSIVNTNVKIAWDAPATNGLAISEYKIMIQNNDTTTYSTETRYCDGADATTISFSYCFIPINILRDLPFYLKQADLVVAIAQAKNAKGFSILSDPNTSGAYIITEPLQMDIPTRGTNTSPNRLDVRWTAISSSPQNGGVAVLSYNLQWDSGTNGGAWTNLLGFAPPSLATSLIITNGVSSGSMYQFRVRAQNLMGWGSFSSPLYIKAAMIPPQMTLPRTSVDVTSGHFKIEWDASITNGDSIDQYLIEIQTKAGAWTTNSLCDGSSLVIIGARYCLIPMSILRDSATFNYAVNNLVQVRISAHNSFGWGDISTTPLTDGGRIRTEPAAMTSPLDNVVLTTSNQITLNWVALSGSATGYSAILSYNLVWNSGTGDPSITLIDSLLLQYTVKGLTEGLPYKFKLRARNIYGYGDYSSVNTLIPSDIPGKMEIPIVEISNINVKIDWEEPDDHSATIDEYEILLQKFDGSFVEDTTNCNGAIAAIRDATVCFIPMTSIITLTLLTRDQLIQVKVRAHNIKGWGDFSELNTGTAYVETTAIAPVAPTFDLSLSANDRVYIEWQSLVGSATGGQSVIIDAYDLQQYESATTTWFTISNTSSIAYLKTGLSGGNTYYFKVRAYNRYGPGVFSPVGSVFTSQAPNKPLAPTLTTISNKVQISFKVPVTNYSPIQKYRILIAAVNGTFIEDPSLCDGSDSQTISNMYCMITMANLLISPFYLERDDPIEAKIQAYNSRGWSEESDIGTGVTISTEPDQMLLPFRGSQTSTNQIQVSWSSLSARRLASSGGSPVISYNLQWDAGTNGASWYDLVGLQPAYLSTSYLVTTGIVSGQSYEFRVRAKNIFGWGSFSDQITLKASTVPAQVATVTTSVDSLTGGLKISWTAPFANGEAIDSYVIEIAGSTAQTLPWKRDLVNCPGVDPNILYCIIPMLNLQTGDFSYHINDIVYVKVTAHNSMGDSPVSTSQSGNARVRGLPKKMTDPFRGSSTTDYQIQAQWNPLTADEDIGYSPILSYNLYWDNGSGTADLQVTDSLVLNYIVLGVEGGEPYIFTVRAKNIYGYGPFSDEITILPQDVPDQVDIPLVQISGTNVNITWSKPFLRYSELDQYQVQFQKSNGDYQSHSNCDGSLQAIKETRTCLVAMTDIITFTGLTVDTLIKVRVRSKNQIEWGPYSQVNQAGATIEIKPTQMEAPTFALSSSSNNNLQVQWITLQGVQKGGSVVAIISYDLFFYNTITSDWDKIYSGTGSSYNHQLLSGGVTYQYKVRATNKYGNGPDSSTSSGFTAQPPSIPTTPEVTIEGIFIKIKWYAPNNNNLPITAYRIKIKDNTNNNNILNYQESIQHCNGASSTIMTNLFCMIPMSVLRTTPFNLPFQSQILVQVQASNQRGWGDLSVDNTDIPTIQTAPRTMTIPQRDSSTSTSQIVVNWQTISSPDNGDSDVTSYNLQWDAGSDGLSWFSLQGLSPSSILSTYTVTSGIIIGSKYKFRLRARNIHGWGPYSDPVAIYAARAPSKVLSVSTEIDSATGGIKVSWLPPNANGDPITQYKIEIANVLTSYWGTSTYCDGTSNQVLTNLYCILPMSIFTEVPYSYLYTNVVKFRISAANSYLFGETSDPNTSGAQVRRKPDQMTKPTQGPQTSDTQIDVQWAPMTTGLTTGNTPILSYNLYWDDGTSTVTIPLIDELVTSYIIEGVEGGHEYKFIVRAKNVYGYGNFSEELSVIPIDLPDQVAIPTVELVNSIEVKIDWAKPNHHYSTITGYQVLFLKSDKSFTEITGCVMISSTVTECTLTMDTIRNSTGLTVNKLIQVKVRALNAKGYGSYSEVNIVGQTVEAKPAVMSPPSIVTGSVTTTLIPLSWTAPTGANAGGTGVTIASYDLQKSTDGSTWTDLALAVTSTTYNHVVTAGSTIYYYKIRATNKYGTQDTYSAASASVVASSIPEIPGKPTLTQDGTSISITWDLPENNQATITAYRVVIVTNDDTTFAENTTLCDGSLNAVVTSRKCLVPISSLANTPFTLSSGKTIKAKVAAINSRGASQLSVESINTPLILMQTAPLKMATPTRETTSTISRMDVKWVALSAPNNGYSAITSYFLEWDSGTNGATWTDVIGNSPASLLTTYSVTGGSSGFTAGQLYGFRVTARNIFGWGPTSDPAYVKAAQAPSTVPTVTTSIDPATGGVQIVWGTPNANGGTISKYKIEINNYVTTTSWTVSSSCDGTSAIVKSAQSCIIPMSELTTTYQYAFDKLVLVRVSSTNEFGDSTSITNLGTARTRSAPDIMAAPSITSSSDTQIIVSWTALTGDATGNSPTTAYTLYWNKGTDANPTTKVTEALVLTYTFSSLSGGSTYKFAVRAINIYGEGPTSTTTTVLAIDKPAKMDIPTVELSTTDNLRVDITWAPPVSHSSDIISYDVQFLKSNNDFTPFTAQCPGTDPLVYTCSVNMTNLNTLIGQPVDTMIRVKVRALNAKGYGSYSEVNIVGQTVEAKPAVMSPPSIVTGSVTTTLIPLSWTAPTGANAGGTGVTIASYDLQKSTDGSTWTDLALAVTSTTYNHVVTAGSTIYYYKIRATNKYGTQDTYSAASASVVASSIPEIPGKPTLTQDGTSISITWDLPENNQATITAYRVVIVTNDDTTFAENTTLCDGSLNAVVTSRKCLVPISSLANTPFTLSSGKTIKAKVAAINSRGASQLSVESINTPLILMQTAPLKMATPTRETTSTISRMDVKWVALSAPNNGYSAITSYFLEWDSGTNGATWTDVIGNSPASLLTTYSVTGGSSGFTAGQLYGFRVTARNIFGWGPTSDPAYVKAAQAPSTVPTVTTSIDPATGGVQIVWGTPNANGGTISKYKIEINNYVTTTSWTVSSSCDGTSAIVKSAQSCIIPMSELTTTYQYAFDKLVLVRVSSTNEFGDSTSITNLGTARTRSAPDIMAAPSITSSSDTQIIVSWTALTGDATGNSPTTAYTLYWNKGTDANPTTKVTEALVLTYTFSSLSGGSTYKFAVRAINIYGEGPTSTTTTVLAIDKPAKMDIPTVELSTTDNLRVDITWAPPVSHSSDIISYDVQFLKSNNDFTPFTAQCPGTDPLVYTCSVNMTNLNTLIGQPVDTMIRVKVRALNAKGYGEYSELSITGATVETPPAQMGAISKDDGLSSSTVLYLTWNALTSNSDKGGSGVSIVNYDLWWDQGSLINTWVQLALTTNSYYQVNDLEPATTYQYYISAINKYGNGQNSPTATFTTSSS
ncbi:pa14 multi-domain protein [Stylonychia lemnae]|uniref:Pa14 multi-domain protein n=1 Tax=Stylonychia lemnae TaxID=5949 RepID=A0A078A029_STYLE|nr:pa14 multi-domain protein [Stylonychia lemnae]|eukprot:CDW74138.1 pa14 multi-domain protein [Stylonychia lemnae]